MIAANEGRRNTNALLRAYFQRFSSVYRDIWDDDRTLVTS